MKHLLETIYDNLLSHFGPQQWWPGETPFEVMVGAILTQNTNWGNVEKALTNLKVRDALTPKAMYQLAPPLLAEAIRPAGYFNIKTKRLRNFLHYFLTTYGGDVEAMRAQSTQQLRHELLAVNGIGPETADSILLYALEKPVFVIDAYTHRILQRHHLAADEATYHELQELFADQLPDDVAYFNEYHALLVATGKQYCKPKSPQCESCPLNGVNW